MSIRSKVRTVHVGSSNDSATRPLLETVLQVGVKQNVAQIGVNPYPVYMNEEKTQAIQDVLGMGSDPRDLNPGHGIEHWLMYYKPIVLVAVTNDWKEIKTLPEEMLRDEDVLMAAVKKNVKALAYAKSPTNKVLNFAIDKNWKVAEAIITKVLKITNRDVLARLTEKRRKEKNED